MHTEAEIKQAIKPLVEKYGALTTTGVKELLSTVLVFDDEDKEPSPTRNEIKIIQRIGNIISHQMEPISIYPEGFIVDKSKKPAIFYAIKGLDGNKEKISKKEIEERKKQAKKSHSSYKKINWDFVNERRTTIGVLGEEFVYKTELDNVKNFDDTSVDRVLHLSIMQGDGLGYDILSLDNKGNTIYIEVKTTSDSNPLTPFYMSTNELDFFRDHDTDAFIYRVYDFNMDSKHGKIQIISAHELFSDYIFDPINFMVKHK